MTNIDLLTRAVELVYMAHGVAEADLVDTMSDAMKIKEIVDEGVPVSVVDDVLFFGFERFNIAVGSTYDDAEFLANLARIL